MEVYCKTVLARSEHYSPITTLLHREQSARMFAPEAYDNPECHVRRYERAHKVLRLPSRCGGVNIIPQHTLAPTRDNLRGY